MPTNTIDDLSERLRQIADTSTTQIRPIRGDLRAAADRIEELEAEVSRLSWLETCVREAIDKGAYLGWGIDEALDGTP